MVHLTPPPLRLSLIESQLFMYECGQRQCEKCNNSIFMQFEASLLQMEIVQNDMETNMRVSTPIQGTARVSEHDAETCTTTLAHTHTKNERKTF